MQLRNCLPHVALLDLLDSAPAAEHSQLHMPDHEVHPGLQWALEIHTFETWLHSLLLAGPVASALHSKATDK
jgi:hypothetical protein